MCDPRRLLRAKAIFFWSLVLAFATTGCEDPSNVGLGVIGESGGDPIRVNLPALERPADITPPVTSNVRTTLGFTAGAVRMLAGSVDDPVFGTISTKAYMDVGLSSTQSADYRNGTITSVRLTLTPDYVYGDTMATTSLILSEMDAEWPGADLTADTILTPGPEIVQFDYVYEATPLEIDLPEAWYSARSSVLLSAGIVDEFHGFELSASNPSAVVGFDATSATFRIVTTTGTADLVVSKLFTHVEREGETNIPAGRAIIQDGVGENVAMAFDFATDSLQGVAVSRAVIELIIDRETMDALPPNFVRPAPPLFDLVAVRSDGTSRLLRSAVSADDAITFVSTTAAPGEFTILRTAQQALTGKSEFDEYHVRISEVQAAINSVVVFAPGSEADAPRATLTVTRHSF